MTFHATLSFALVLSTAITGCSLGQSCTDVGCTSSATGTFDVPFALDELVDRRIEICRGNTCVHATIFVRDGGPDCAWRGSDPRAAHAACEPSAERLPGGVRIHPVYHPGSGERLADGDQFTYRLTDASGETTLAKGGGRITAYRHVQPNGAACDGAFECQQGRF